MKQYIAHQTFRFFGENGPIIFASVFDNCAGDEEMRERWISSIGWFSFRFRYKPYRDTLEFGFEWCGYLCTIFVE